MVPIGAYDILAKVESSQVEATYVKPLLGRLEKLQKSAQL